MFFFPNSLRCFDPPTGVLWIVDFGRVHLSGVDGPFAVGGGDPVVDEADLTTAEERGEPRRGDMAFKALAGKFGFLSDLSRPTRMVRISNRIHQCSALSFTRCLSFPSLPTPSAAGPTQPNRHRLRGHRKRRKCGRRYRLRGGGVCLPDLKVRSLTLNAGGKEMKVRFEKGQMALNDPDNGWTIFNRMSKEDFAKRNAGGAKIEEDPHIHMRYKVEGKDMQEAEIFMDKYTMNLEFGTAKDGNIPGKIHLRLPDKAWTPGRCSPASRPSAKPSP